MALDIGAWRISRVIMLALAWLLLVPLLTVCYFLLRFYLDARMSGSAGIGAVSVGVPELAIGFWLLPPVLFFALWIVLRSRRTRRPPA